jgi:hypothetical protein
MLRAQGVPPIDHHAVLELHPSAPRQLVVEAYFALARRRAAQPAPRRRAELRPLHAAYAAAMAERRDHDVSSCTVAHPADYYAVLCVDPAAGADIIELAYRLLPALQPLPERSVARYLRDEAFRVLTNPHLRARYDRDRQAGTLWSTQRSALRTLDAAGPSPRKERIVPDRNRGLFGFGRRRSPPPDARDVRLLGLREILAVPPDEPLDEAPGDVVADGAAPMAELVFTAGPRAGMRVELDTNVASLADGRATASIWRHNDRFLLRHNGKRIRIGGATPALSVVVLEDGDEIALGAERARFMLVPRSP